MKLVRIFLLLVAGFVCFSAQADIYDVFSGENFSTRNELIEDSVAVAGCESNEECGEYYELDKDSVAVAGREVIDLETARKMAVEHNRALKVKKIEGRSTSLQRERSFINFLPSFDAEVGYQRKNKQYQLFENDMFLPVVPWQTIDPETGGFDFSALQNPQLAQSTLALNPQTGEPLLDGEGNPLFLNYALLPAEKGKIGQKNNYKLGFTISQPIYMGGKIRSGYKIARKAEFISEADYEMSLSDVLYRTDELYWQVVSLEEKVKLADNYLDMLSRLVFDLENLYSEGIITHNQVLLAKVKYNEIDLLRVKAMNGLRLSRMAFNQHVGRPLLDRVPLDETFNLKMLSFDEDSLSYVALRQRSEIHMLNSAVEIAEEMVKVSRADMLPSIGLMASYNITNPNPYNGFKDEFGGDYAVGIGVNIPIFHFGDKRKEVAQAKLKRDKLKLQRDEALEMIELQVNQSLCDLSEARVRREMTNLSLEQAEENLKITQDLFKEGRATTRDVLESQAYWQEAYESRIDARNNEMMAYTKLLKNIGELL
jgi:outer membrane protein TolC